MYRKRSSFECKIVSSGSRKVKTEDHVSGSLSEVLLKITSVRNIYTVVDLRSHDLGDTGVKLLAEALKNKNNCVEALYLSFNRISDEGGREIINLLEYKNCKLKQINIWRNHLSDQMKNKIKEACSKRNIRSILSDSDYSDFRSY